MPNGRGMTETQASEGEAHRKPGPPTVVAGLILFTSVRIGYVLDVVLIGLGVGTVIDMAISPRLLAPEDSLLVTSAMLPMIVSLGVMAALTLTDIFVAAFVREHPRFDLRHHIRRPLRFQMRLAYHGYLIFAGAGICVWTQIFLWRGHWVVWTFGVALALAGNFVSQACRFAIMMAGKGNAPPKKREPVGPVEIALIVAGILLGIYGLVQRFH